MTSFVYDGTVVHTRRAPVANTFRYRVCFYLIDLARLEELHARLRLFGYNRRRAVSFHDRDHLGDPDRPVAANLAALLERRGVAPPGGRTLLLTNLRVAGYVFNPVSFYYCHDPAGRLQVIVAEVSNTFGEMHAYVLSAANRVPDASEHAYVHKKELHVSPFMGLDADYRFFFSAPGDRLYARIDEHDADGRFFGSVLAGTERRELTDGAIVRTLARHPLFTVKVTGLIHWQALRLARLRVPFRRKPPFVQGEGSVRP